MRPTPREESAARSLGAAMLELLSAVEEAAAERRQQAEARRRAESAPRPGAPALMHRTAEEAKARGLVSPRDAKDYLSISAGTLWNMTAPRGPIPAIKIGTLVRYRLSDLDAYVQKEIERRRQL